LYRLIYKQNFQDFEILIIDNGSTDDTISLINERFPQLKIVKHRENLGFAKAHNQAIHWSKSDYILVLNQDVILEPDYLKNLVEFLDTHPQAGSVTGKILRLKDNQKTKYVDTLGLEIGKNHRVVEIGAGEIDEGQFNTNKEVFGISGAIPIYRRNALKSVEIDQPFFDEDFFSYKEDVDLAYRLKYAGWRAYYIASALAYHHRSASGSEAKTTAKIAKNRGTKSNFTNYLSYRNHFYFLIKNLPAFNFHYLWPVFWFEFLKFFYILIFETKNLKVLGEVRRNRQKFFAKRHAIMSKKKIKLGEIEKWYM
jgi:GT2 family glycosyltransferase